MAKRESTLRSTLEVGVMDARGEVADIGRADEVLEATLSREEYAKIRADNMPGAKVVYRDVKVVTSRSSWRDKR